MDIDCECYLCGGVGFDGVGIDVGDVEDVEFCLFKFVMVGFVNDFLFKFFVDFFVVVF